MACGQKYAQLVPKRVDLGSPFVLGWSAYAERKAAADTLFAMVAARRSDAQAKGAAEALETRWAGYHTAHEDLPSSTFLDLRPDEQLISLAQSNAEEGACMMELYDQALGTVAKVPAPGAPSSPLGGLFDVGPGTIVLLGAGAYALWRFSR